ncbi:ABC transporter permease [Clostridium botulinum]|uniref:ABC transporter permease n=1 Tax=Clostridium botulinum TaxID=1491 RepID=UPI001FAEBB94|nr:ABC transporter permease [Clostridium botulinum]
MKKLNDDDKQMLIKKINIGILVLYCIMSILFYILAGEQLHFRPSRGNIERPIPNNATIELIKGSSVSQTFTNDIQILEKFTVDFGDYKRINKGVINVTLKDLTNNVVILSQDINGTDIKEGNTNEFYLSEPLEGLYNHSMIIEIKSLEGDLGLSTTPLMKNENLINNAQLYFNNQPVEGTLCFSVKGEDYIWFGLNYWKFVLAGGILTLMLCITMDYKVRKCRRILIFDVIVAMKRYRFLIEQMVARDFKTKYKRSILGIFWSFLNPLLTMLVQYFVFSNIFKNDIPYYHVYLIIGVVMFNFFSEACGMTLTSILGNANLMTKVYVPKYIYPLVRVASSTVNLLISLVPLLLITIFSGITFTKAIFLTLFALLCLIVFSLGLGLLLSTLMVFFRDTQFLWGVFNMIWMYLTPIFYPENILPEQFSGILKCNPLYYYVNFVRSCIIDGVSPEPRVYFICIMSALAMFLVGAFVFRKNQDKFIFYL